MISNLISISYVAPAQYRVELEVVGTQQTVTFDFRVDNDNAPGIEVVRSGDKFAAHVDSNFGRTAPLVEAVLRFHRARQAEYP